MYTRIFEGLALTMSYSKNAGLVSVTIKIRNKKIKKQANEMPKD